MTARFRANPALLLYLSGVLPPGNYVTKCEMVPDGRLEFTFEGIDAEDDPAGQAPPLKDLLTAVTERGRRTSWFETPPASDLTSPPGSRWTSLFRKHQTASPDDKDLAP